MRLRRPYCTATIHEAAQCEVFYRVAWLLSRKPSSCLKLPLPLFFMHFIDPSRETRVLPWGSGDQGLHPGLPDPGQTLLLSLNFARCHPSESKTSHALFVVTSGRDARRDKPWLLDHRCWGIWAAREGSKTAPHRTRQPGMMTFFLNAVCLLSDSDDIYPLPIFLFFFFLSSWFYNKRERQANRWARYNVNSLLSRDNSGISLCY